MQINNNQKSISTDIHRMVETQENSVTMRLTESLEEQSLLESTLEEAKPQTLNRRHYHYLISPPFRYHP